MMSLQEDVDEETLSAEEQKERKIMKLLLKIKNGTPPMRKVTCVYVRLSVCLICLSHSLSFSLPSVRLQTKPESSEPMLSSIRSYHCSCHQHLKIRYIPYMGILHVNIKVWQY